MPDPTPYEINQRAAERSHDDARDLGHLLNEATTRDAQGAIRVLLAVNGGAAVALLAFTGGLVARAQLPLATIAPIVAEFEVVLRWCDWFGSSGSTRLLHQLLLCGSSGGSAPDLGIPVCSLDRCGEAMAPHRLLLPRSRRRGRLGWPRTVRLRPVSGATDDRGRVRLRVLTPPADRCESAPVKAQERRCARLLSLPARSPHQAASPHRNAFHYDCGNI
jgi:hypothetical protein